MLPNPRELVLVGFMERDCSRVRNNEQIPAVPVGLTVTPVQAAHALPHGCGTKFLLNVYADTSHYYFFDNTQDFLSFSGRTAEGVKASSYVVDGRSGVLVATPGNE